jgi:hypothetical protein
MRPVAHIEGNPEIHEKYNKNTDNRLLHFAVHAKKIYRTLKYGIQL